MADAPSTPASAAKSGNLGFLTRKVGPFPVYVWVALVIGGYFLYEHFSGASSTSSTSAAASTIDPTTGLPYSEEAIDPATGEPYSEEYGAAESQLDTTSSSAATTGGEAFSSNDQWATAAINFLVGVGIDPSVATQAIENYLGGLAQPSQQYQADVNSAVEAIGPPPTLPGPSTGNPNPITGGNPPPTSGKSPTKSTRQTADGKTSLDQVAKERNTTTAHIISTTISSHGTGNGIDTANLAKFNAYVAKGTSKPMPAGLVYYTTNP